MGTPNIDGLNYKALVKRGVITPAKCVACGTVLKPYSLVVEDTKMNHALKYSNLIRIRSRRGGGTQNDVVKVNYWVGSFIGRLVNSTDICKLGSRQVYYSSVAKNLNWLCLENCSAINAELSKITKELNAIAAKFSVFREWNLDVNFRSLHISGRTGRGVVTDAMFLLLSDCYFSNSYNLREIEKIRQSVKSSKSYPYSEIYYNPPVSEDDKQITEK